MCQDGGSEPSVELSTVRKGEGGGDGIIRDSDFLMVVVVVLLLLVVIVVVVVKVVTFVVV